MGTPWLGGLLGNGGFVGPQRVNATNGDARPHGLESTADVLNGERGVLYSVCGLTAEEGQHLLVHVPSAAAHRLVGKLRERLMHEVVQVRPRGQVDGEQAAVDVRDADDVAPVADGEAHVPTVMRPVRLHAPVVAILVLDGHFAEVTLDDARRRSLWNDPVTGHR